MTDLIVKSAYEPEKIIATLKKINRSEAFDKLSVAYDLFNDRSRRLPAYERIKMLKAAVTSIQSRRMELALQAAEEGGKPLTDSLVEIDRAINGIEIAVQEISSLKGEEIKMGITPSSADRMAFTRREPRGVVLAISAFNHPFNLIIHQVIPALAVGAPVLIKPASSTPLSCISLIAILHEAGFPPDWCQLLLCDSTVAQELVSDSRISFMSFIGSAEVGFKLKSLLAPGAHCVLEHGGVAPCILDSTADLKYAASKILKGAFYHAGQVCVSVQKLYVHESILQTFLDIFLPQVEHLVIGDPISSNTDIGPLITPEEVDRVERWVKEATEEGAELLIGGRRLTRTTYEPTVLLNPADTSLVSSKEIFGPVLLINSYTDVQEAYEAANQLPYTFQASMFTNDLNSALEATNRLKAQAVMINDHTAFRVDWMPFGGSEQSGYGTGGIGPSMRDMSYEKLMVFHSDKLGLQ